MGIGSRGMNPMTYDGVFTSRDLGDNFFVETKD